MLDMDRYHSGCEVPDCLISSSDSRGPYLPEAVHPEQRHDVDQALATVYPFALDVLLLVLK
jgi:hypothetical protein